MRKKDIKSNDILKIIYQNKRKVKRLYELYSLKFPDHKDLWENLVKKKQGQLKILKDLNIKFSDSSDFLKIDDCAGEIINYIDDFIELQFKIIKAANITSKEALAIGLRLEQSVLEKRPFAILKPLSAHLELALRRISQDSNRYLGALTRTFNKETYSI